MARSGHRRNCVIERGYTIGQFLQKAKAELEKSDFPELRTVGSDTLMYVKEDLIIPHNVSFYDLIKEKARGKSGPLFHFDVHEDIRMSNDSRIEKDESSGNKGLSGAIPPNSSEHRPKTFKGSAMNQP
eukprot:Skav208619  [mRNA]  locus=scaffold248:551148:555761:- [translate_table: standard]